MEVWGIHYVGAKWKGKGGRGETLGWARMVLISSDVGMDSSEIGGEGRETSTGISK